MHLVIGLQDRRQARQSVAECFGAVGERKRLPGFGGPPAASCAASSVSGRERNTDSFSRPMPAVYCGPILAGLFLLAMFAPRQGGFSSRGYYAALFLSALSKGKAPLSKVRPRVAT